MLDALWLLPVGLLAVWALWSGDSLLTLVTSLALLVPLSLVLWRRWSLAGVTFSRRLSEHRAFFGQRVELVIEVLNLKPLPLTWLRVEESVPRHLPLEGGTVQLGRSDLSRYLVSVLAMLPYERVVRRVQVHCTRRGEHLFGPTHLTSGDYLGLLLSFGGTFTIDRLLVFPKIFPVVLSRVASNQIVGKEAVRRILLTDPVRTIGVRQYVPGDPFRIIDWRASARSADLMVRIFEPSTTPVLDIVVNFAVPVEGADKYEPDELELVISVAASLAAYAVERRWSVGLRGNGWSRSGPIAVPPSGAPSQLAEILEVLAHASTRPNDPISRLLMANHGAIPGGTSLVLVTAELPDEVVATLLELRRRGRPVTVIRTGREPANGSDGPIPVWHIPYDEQWTEREALVLGE